MILDEATSALDVESESEFAATLETLRSDRTVLIIAHRPVCCVIAISCSSSLAGGQVVGSGKQGQRQTDRVGEPIVLRALGAGIGAPADTGR